MATYDSRTALIVVDVQNDFADPKGSLYVPDGEKVVPFINEEIARALAAGAFVVYTQDWHPPSTPHFAENGGSWPVHCLQGTWGSELHPELTVGGPQVRVGAGGGDGYSGFEAEVEGATSELEGLLRDRGAGRVVVAGLATDYCVRATAIDAARTGYRTSVLREGVRAVNVSAGDEAGAFDEMREAGVEIE